MYLCEYLPRLGQTTIYLETPDPVNRIKELKFENNSLYIKNTSEHNVLLPDLDQPDPADSFSQSKPIIRNIVHNDNELVIRMNAAAPQSSKSTSSFMNLSSGSQLWSVKDLLEKTPKSASKVNEFRFLCANCDAEIVNSKEFKFGDMPLEFWHELMDFWHCHKPHEEHHNHNDKNYDGKLALKPGFVYIGSSYILFNSESNQCKNCHYELGDADVGNTTTKLHKWNLKLEYGNQIETYPPYIFVYHSVLDKINSAGMRKFVIVEKGSDNGIKIWISAVGLNICINGARHSNALKMLYISSSPKSDDDVLEVPGAVWHSFTTNLEEVTLKIPKNSRVADIVEEGVKQTFLVGYLFPN